MGLPFKEDEDFRRHNQKAQGPAAEELRRFVEATETDTTVVLELSVAKDDVGKVIGKQGRIARALRTIVKASAVRDGKRAIVEIVD